MKLSPSEWLMQDKDLPPMDSEAYSSLFSISNGFFCCRGTLPFADVGTHGTFIGGVYALGPADISWIPGADHSSRNLKDFPSEKEIMKFSGIMTLPVAPNLFASRMPDEKAAFTLISRNLDLKKGFLEIDGRIKTASGVWNLKVQRLVSMNDRRIAAERLIFKPELSNQVNFSLELGYDCEVRNLGKYCLWENIEKTVDGSFIAWKAESAGRKQKIAFRMEFARNGKLIETTDKSISDSYICLKLAGETVIDRFITIETEDAEFAKTGEALSFEQVFEQHCESWDKLWNRADIKIDGPATSESHYWAPTSGLMASTNGTTSL